MKKIATLLLAAGLVFGVATGASAIDFKAKGQWIMSFDYGQNGGFTGGAGQTGFNIELSKCSAAIKTAAAFFESGGGVDPASGNVKNISGSATKVQLQLVDATNGNAIKAGNTSQVTSTSRVTVDPTALTAVLPYAVQYYAQSATTPGTVVGSVTYSINYQ